MLGATGGLASNLVLFNVNYLKSGQSKVHFVMNVEALQAVAVFVALFPDEPVPSFGTTQGLSQPCLGFCNSIISFPLQDLWKRKHKDLQMNNRKEDMEIASHYRHLLRELNEQRQHGILCDVCIIVEGKIFKAHKNVLLGSSRYFKTLYCQVQKTSDQATVTHLDIVTAQGFKAIIDFMYSAHLALTSRNVIEVMSAASYLQMTDIVQACHNFIKAALDISIKSDASEDLVDYELGAPSSSSTDALISAVVAGRSISPWLARRTSPANSSGDSAIASCHEGGSSYGKEDQEPKPDSHEDISSQSLWASDMGYGSLRIKEEQVSPSHYGGGELHSAKDSAIQSGFSEQGGGDGWQPTGRRKNRKNKETVRHITQQVEDDSRANSPVLPLLPASGWPYSSRDPSKSFFQFLGMKTLT